MELQPAILSCGVNDSGSCSLALSRPSPGTLELLTERKRMARDFRPDSRETAVISKLDHARESQRVNAMNLLRQNLEELSERVSTKLIEERLVETMSKEALDHQIQFCLESLLTAEEFDIQFQTANIRDLVPRPHFVSLFLTAFIIEKLINHKSIVEIYGTDLDIYRSVHKQISRTIPLS